MLMKGLLNNVFSISSNKINHYNLKSTNKKLRIQSKESNNINEQLKSGTIGKERFEQDAIAGTYFSKEPSSEEKVVVTFETGSKPIKTRAHAGDNILNIAEKCKAVKINSDYCLEGTCELCVMEVEGGKEVGWRKDPKAGNIVRTCITPVPSGKNEVTVRVLNDDDVWMDGVI